MAYRAFANVNPRDIAQYVPPSTGTLIAKGIFDAATDVFNNITKQNQEEMKRLKILLLKQSIPLLLITIRNALILELKIQLR